MSVVTGVFLWGGLDDTGVDLLQAWLQAKGFQRLAPLDAHASGGKHPQADWFGAGYNNFPNEEFIAAFKTTTWEQPETVMLLLQSEHSQRPAVIFPNGHGTDVPQREER